jgi:hypothetical protein
MMAVGVAISFTGALRAADVGPQHSSLCDTPSFHAQLRVRTRNTRRLLPHMRPTWRAVTCVLSLGQIAPVLSQEALTFWLPRINGHDPHVGYVTK